MCDAVPTPLETFEGVSGGSGECPGLTVECVVGTAEWVAVVPRSLDEVVVYVATDVDDESDVVHV